jgi:hypothetical protein
MAELLDERELALMFAEEQEVRANALFEQRESALAARAGCSWQAGGAE